MTTYTIPCAETGCVCNPLPPDDPDLMIWLRPDYGQVISAGKMQSWLDYSSAGNNVLSPGGDVGGTLNGFTWLVCDSGGLLWQTATSNRWDSATIHPGLTFMVVFKTAEVTPYSDSGPINFGYGGSCGSNRGLALDDGPACMGLHILCTTDPVVTTGINPNTWYFLALTVLENTGAGTAALNAYINGTLVGTATGTGLGARFTGAGATIGSTNNFPNRHPGSVESIAFRRVLTNTELNDFWDYVQAKYNL